ncbi:RidA family protein [Marivita sp.]|uniref:RidA family protein n=1 Tax=Marivita sp. TaxID=2003365 RepID=UPI00261C303E|nr:RidA family protein [Marivita sp.]
MAKLKENEMKAFRHQIGPRMSQAVRAGDMVYLAGQIPDDRKADITVQTSETLGKIDALLAEMGGSKSDLVSVQVWLSDMSDFAGMNTAWAGWVDSDNPPARATAGVALASPSVRVEIIGTAYIRS